MVDRPGGSSIARRIDISAVQSHHGEREVRALATAARVGGFVNAHVLPTWVPLLAELLAGSGTLVGAPVGFPSGGATTAVKVAEAERLLADGARELDVTTNAGRLRSGDDAFVARELHDVLAAIPRAVPTKVIVESSLLTPDEIRRGAELAADAGADFVKTGTGWAGRPTSMATIELIRTAVGDRVGIKASGGLRDLDTIRAMEARGVSRFGLNVEAAVAVVSEERRRMEAVG